MPDAIIAGLATVAVAILTYFFTYINNRIQNSWQTRLERTDAQLKDFYGPLLALSQTSDRTWRLLMKEYKNDLEKLIREDNGDLWVLWVTEIFQPINKKMSSIIVEHADLLAGDSMPECLLNLVAHTSGYDATIERWKKGDRKEMFSIVDWPDNLTKYLETSFTKLKEEQQDLIGRINKASKWKIWRHGAADQASRVPVPAGGSSGDGAGQGHDDQRAAH
jgi:hypothetical protein